MTMKIRSPFPWFGGKGTPRIRNFIIENMPEHRAYLEPFGGGASILISKSPSAVEVYNDVNRGVVNFFRVIADNDLFGKFMARTSLLPVSRELFEEYSKTWVGIHDPVEQAIRWYVVARQSFSGVFGNSWGSTVNSSTGGMAQTAHSWKSALNILPQVHERMQRVQIECSDWRDCLERYSGSGWLAYCDPPYVAGVRKAGGYDHELKNKDHKELVEALLDYDGAVLLSGYNNSIYAPLEKNGWKKTEIQVTCSAAGRTRASGLQGSGKVLAKQKRTEVLWKNPEALRRKKSGNNK